MKLKLDALTLFAVCLLGTPFTFAQDTPVPTVRELKLSDLPPVPDDLKELVEANELTFRIGGPRPSLIDQSRSTGSSTRRFDAETQFRLSYTFRSRCQWKTVASPSTPNSIKQLAIQVRFDRIRTSLKHHIWLRRMPDEPGFWDSPLVRHEFDHVRISSDPRLVELFRKSVLKHERMELTRAESEPLIALAYRKWNASWFGRGTLLNYLKNDDAKVWVKKAVQGEFDRLVELVEIRYAELDRVTDHGRRSVPADGPLRDWLNR